MLLSLCRIIASVTSKVMDLMLLWEMKLHFQVRNQRVAAL